MLLGLLMTDDLFCNVGRSRLEFITKKINTTLMKILVLLFSFFVINKMNKVLKIMGNN